MAQALIQDKLPTTDFASGGALTLRAGIIALALVLLWTLGSCTIAVNGFVYVQQFMMIVGFGAILTVFLLQMPRLFIATVLIVYAGTWALFYVQSTAEDYERLSQGLWVSLPVALAMLGGAIYLSRRPLTRRELAVIYACVVIAIPWCICIKAVIESSTSNLFEQQRRSEGQVYAWSKEMPWWGPTIPTGPGHAPDARALQAVRGFARGNGGHVPWDLWWRPIAYWTAMCVAFQAMLMGLLLMFRRRWIEHERLPFVWSQPALQIIGTEDSYKPSRRHWVMFAIGLGICLPGIIFVGPAGEPLHGWTVPPWAGQEGLRGGFDLTSLNLLPNLPLRLFWGPLVLTVFLLFPLDVLMTVAVTYIVTGLLLPQILSSLGIPFGQARLDDFIKWGLRFGGGVGILVWSLWYNRKTIAEYLAAPLMGLLRLAGIADRGSRNPDSGAARASGNTPPPEPRVSQWPATLCLGGMAAFIILGCYATTPIQILLLTFFALVYAFTQARQRVEGLPFTSDNNIGSHQMVSIQRDILHDHFNLASQGVAVTPNSWAAHFFQWGFCGQLKTLGPHNMLLEAFKIGHELKVHARTIGLVVLLTMGIVAVVTPALYLLLMYTYGFENSFQGDLATWSSFTQWSERAISYGVHSTSQVFLLTSENWYDRYRNILNAVLGVILIGALFYLRREYPRFGVNPIGVVLAAEYFGEGGPWSPLTVWFSFLLAGVAKSLIFRWMGVRSFREKIQPAVILLLCGMIYGMMLYLFRQLSLGFGFLK